MTDLELRAAAEKSIEAIRKNSAGWKPSDDTFCWPWHVIQLLERLENAENELTDLWDVEMRHIEDVLKETSSALQQARDRLKGKRKSSGEIDKRTETSSLIAKGRKLLNNIDTAGTTDEMQDAIIEAENWFYDNAEAFLDTVDELVESQKQLDSFKGCPSWDELNDQEAQTKAENIRLQERVRVLEGRIDRALHWLDTESIHCEGPTCRLLRNHMNEASAALEEGQCRHPKGGS